MMEVESVVHLITRSYEEQSAVMREFPSATWFSSAGLSAVCTFTFLHSDLEKVKRFVKKWKGEHEKEI